mgnify:CR=1 FL=1
MTTIFQWQLVLAGVGVIFTSLSCLSYPAIAEQACVRTSAGQSVCGELLPKERGNVTQKIEATGFIFELQGCRRSGDDVSCNILITNVGDSDTICALSNSSRIISTSGEEFEANKVQVGSGSSRLIRGIPVKAVLSFRNTPSRVSNLAVLEVSYEYPPISNRERSIQFRNVAIQK